MYLKKKKNWERKGLGQISSLEILVGIGLVFFPLNYIFQGLSIGLNETLR